MPTPILPSAFTVQRGVNVPGHLAGVLLAAGGLDDFRRRIRGQNAEVDALLDALQSEALAWRRMARSRHGHDTSPQDEQSQRRSGLSTGQAAAALGCSVRTVQRDIATGRLPAHLVGGRWVLEPEDVERSRAQRADPATRSPAPCR